MLKFLRSEQARINIVLLFIPLFFAHLLCLEYRKRLDAGNRRVIGEVTLQMKDTKRKFSSEVIWETVNVRFPVYENDTIKTDEFSEIVVKLNDGTQVKLNENTMAVFSYTEDQLNVGLSRGGVELENAQNTKLISDENQFFIKNGKLSANKGYTKTVDLKVQEGEIVLDSDGKMETIDKNSIVKVRQEKILQKEKVARMISPVSKYIPSSQNKENIQFSWEPPDPNRKYQLEISNAVSRGIVKSQQVNGTSLDVSLPVGNYRWRLVPQSKDEVTPQNAQFAILSTKPLEIILPQSDYKVTVVKQTPRILFRWVKEEFYKNYTLEVSNTQDFSKPTVSRDSFSDETMVDNLPPGKYYYRVVARPILGGMEPKFSLVRSFEIISASKPVPIDLVSPENKKEFFSEGKKDISNTFVWKKNREYESYEFEISRNPSFQEIVYKEKTSEHFAVLKQELSPGVYFWRVRGSFSENQIDSNSRSFTIISGQKIKLLSPMGTENYEVGILEFSWSDISPGSKYIVELSKDPNFQKNLGAFNTEKNFLSLPIQEPGKYFWRVRLADSIVSTKLKYDVGSFTIKPEPSVEILFPEHKSVVDLSPVEEVEFRWKPLPDVVDYSLELIRLPERKSILTKKNLKVTNFKIQDLKTFKRGEYELKLSARVSDAKGERNAKTAISRFEIILSKVSSKEDLKFTTPEEIFLE